MKYQNRNLESVCAKRKQKISPHTRIPACMYPQRAHTSIPLGGDKPTLLSPLATRRPAAPPSTAILAREPTVAVVAAVPSSSPLSYLSRGEVGALLPHLLSERPSPWWPTASLRGS
jgi:hypothetical protein